MKPQRCPVCQSENLYDPLGSPVPPGTGKGVIVDLDDNEGITIRPANVNSSFWSNFWPSFPASVKAHFTVCLGCGFVMPYVDDAGLALIALIQKWHDKEKPPLKAQESTDER